ncbi:uncharacterized protein LOC120358380 [Solenopsis invicta]|uniref:uncharacterized protein LOC120358380 n=1 Tax=Solenopsis invicta TaxID=13686 RepID=UPI00193C9AC5|nr:uncharacterized protein LOC120358380 [Solenopsis invicta]
MALIEYKWLNAAYLKWKLYLWNYNKKWVHTCRMTSYVIALHEADCAIRLVRNTRNLRKPWRTHFSHAGRRSSGVANALRINVHRTSIGRSDVYKRTSNERSRAIWPRLVLERLIYVPKSLEDKIERARIYKFVKRRLRLGLLAKVLIISHHQMWCGTVAFIKPEIQRPRKKIRRRLTAFRGRAWTGHIKKKRQWYISLFV